MGFEGGSISCRMFYVPGGLSEKCVEAFARYAAPPIDTLGRQPVSGWVTGRHLLDRNITEETAYYGGYLRLTLMKAERKIPEALLRAECRIEELAAMQAKGVAFLKRDERAKIREGVIDRLLPGMPPTLKGIPVIYDGRSRLLYAGATADKQVEALSVAFKAATRITLVPVTPVTAALERGKVNAADFEPSSFSPEIEDEGANANPGRDFLTWLWFFSERKGGLVNTDLGEFGVMIEGPLLFIHEGGGAHEAVLRKGAPLLSAEAKTSLLSGKKLRSARVVFAHGEQVWQAVLDADQFVLRGIKLPQGDNVDAISKFQQRMAFLQTFRETLLTAYDIFLESRANKQKWRAMQKEIQSWVAARQSKG